MFEFAYPNIICKAELFYIPNDPYFQYQVTLHNIGQTFNGHTGTAGADIKAPQAWDITKGNSNIVVAVLDAGVTSDHPDLPNTRQVRLNGSNFGSGNPNDPSPTGNDNHGNSCAGVIAATMDNNPKMSIRIARGMQLKFLMDTIRKFQHQFTDMQIFILH